TSSVTATAPSRAVSPRKRALFSARASVRLRPSGCGGTKMRRAVARLPVCVLTLIAALAGSTARAEKQYCTPEAYLPAQIEASLKVCDALIADKRHPLRDYVQAYENRGDLYMRKGQPDVAM